MADLGKYIDVWDVGTFDPALIMILDGGSQMVRDYLETDRQIFLDHDHGRNRTSTLRPSNPYASDHQDFVEAIGREMALRTIRAYHYTRMTDIEVDALGRDGVHLSTVASLQKRFDAVVAAGEMMRETADKLYATSPFHSTQKAARSDKFWMTSHPAAIDDSGVVPLLAHWGGEVASMWNRDETLAAALAALGKARVIELAVPLSATNHSYHAGKAVVATFARSRGSIPDKQAFDLYAREPLPATAVLAVHSEGEQPFEMMARGYPPTFADVDVGRWKELTGEED